MRSRESTKTITITITEAIQLDMREATFLRKMAAFCVEHRMSGCAAARRLDAALMMTGVSEYDDSPVHGLFEKESTTP